MLMSVNLNLLENIYLKRKILFLLQIRYDKKREYISSISKLVPRQH